MLADVTSATVPIQTRQAPPRWQADSALAFVAFVWGTTFVVVKSALLQISTMYFLSLRFSVATVCMLVLFGRAFQKAGAAAVWKGLRGGLIAGLFLWAGYVLQTLGLKYTSAGNSGFLTGLYIVLVPLISAAVFRRWPSVRELAGIALATGGMAVLAVPSVDRNMHVNRGDLLTIGCAVAFAFHLLLLGYYSQREQFEAVATGQIACAAILSAGALLVEPAQVQWSRGVLFAILLTAVFATALAFALQTWGQQYTTATRTALIFALEPVFALVTAVAVGGEKLTAAAIGGGILILAGILAVELRPASRA